MFGKRLPSARRPNQPSETIKSAFTSLGKRVRQLVAPVQSTRRGVGACPHARLKRYVLHQRGERLELVVGIRPMLPAHDPA